MVRGIILAFLCLIGSASFAQEINWYIPPFADSVTEENLYKDDFRFTENGKVGYVYGMIITVPAKYDDVVFTDNYRLFYYIKNNKKWGIYYTNDTVQKELLPCIYDTIYEMEYPLFKVVKGNSCAFYHMYYKKWATSFVQNCKLAPKPVVKYTGDERMPEAGIVHNDGRSSKSSNHKKRRQVTEDEENVTEVVENKPITTVEKIEKIDPYIEKVRKLYPNENVGRNSRLNSNLLLYYLLERQYSVLYKVSTQSILIDSLYGAELYGKYIESHPKGGYIAYDTLTGKALTPLYKSVGYFYRYYFDKNKLQDKYIFVKINDKQGMYSRDYEIVIPFEFDNISFGGNKDLVFCETNNKKIKLFNLATKKFIEEKFDSIIYNSANAPLLVKKGKKYFTFNPQTEEMEKMPFTIAYNLIPEDSLLLVNRKSKMQIYNLNQKSYKGKLYDSLYFINIENHDTYINKDGHLLSKLKVTPKHIVKNVIACREGTMLGVLNRDGNILIAPIYTKILAYPEFNRDELLYVNQKQIILKNNNYSYIYNTDSAKFEYDSITQLKIIQNSSSVVSRSLDFWYKRNNLWGFFNLYKQNSLIEHYDTFYSQNGIYILKQNEKYKLYDYSTLMLEQEDYDTIFEWYEGKYLTLQNHKYGLIDTREHSIIPCEYDSIYKYSPDYNNDYNSMTILKKDNKMGYYFDEKYYSLPIFENLELGYNSLIWAKYDGKWGIVDPSIKHTHKKKKRKKAK